VRSSTCSAVNGITPGSREMEITRADAERLDTIKNPCPEMQAFADINPIILGRKT